MPPWKPTADPPAYRCERRRAPSGAAVIWSAQARRAAANSSKSVVLAAVAISSVERSTRGAPPADSPTLPRDLGLRRCADEDSHVIPLSLPVRPGVLPSRTVGVRRPPPGSEDWLGGGWGAAQRPPRGEHHGTEAEDRQHRADEGNEPDHECDEESDGRSRIWPLRRDRPFASPEQPLAEPDGRDDVADEGDQRPDNDQQTEAGRDPDDRRHRQHCEDRRDDHREQADQEGLAGLTADQRRRRSRLARRQPRQQQADDEGRDSHADPDRQGRSADEHAEAGDLAGEVIHRPADLDALGLDVTSEFSWPTSPRTVVPGFQVQRPVHDGDALDRRAADGGGAVDHDERVDGPRDARITVDHDDGIGLLVRGDFDVAAGNEQDASRVRQLLVGREGNAGHAEGQSQHGDEHEDLLHLDLLCGPSTRQPVARRPGRPALDVDLSLRRSLGWGQCRRSRPATPNGRWSLVSGARAARGSPRPPAGRRRSPRRPWTRRARDRHRRTRPRSDVARSPSTIGRAEPSTASEGSASASHGSTRLPSARMTWSASISNSSPVGMALRASGCIRARRGACARSGARGPGHPRRPRSRAGSPGTRTARPRAPPRGSRPSTPEAAPGRGDRRS